MKVINTLFSNDVLNTALMAWFTAQLIKVLSYFVRHKKINFERMIGSGGMPSSHTAFVCALTTSVWKAEGFGSPVFALSAVFAAVVMYDAAGVRRAAGEQAKLLNKMMEEWKNYDNNVRQEQLKELLGHTKKEVIAGMFLGVGLALIYNYLLFGY